MPWGWKLTDAVVRVSPESVAGATQATIPIVEIRQADAVRLRNGTTAVAPLGEDELVTPGRHTILRGRGGRDAIARGRSRRGAGWFRGGGAPDNANTVVGVEPEELAVVADALVPGVEVGERDAVGGQDLAARVAALGLVELVAAVDHSRLRWRGRAHAVARRRGARTRRRLGRGGLIRDAEVALHAVGLPRSQLARSAN